MLFWPSVACAECPARASATARLVAAMSGEEPVEAAGDCDSGGATGGGIAPTAARAGGTAFAALESLALEVLVWGALAVFFSFDFGAFAFALVSLALLSLARVSFALASLTLF